MIFEKIWGALQKREDEKDSKKESPAYKLAEGMIREAIERGARSINMKCQQRKDRDSSDPARIALDPIADDLMEQPDSSVRIRNRGYFWGISLKINEEEHPFMVPPVELSIELIHIFYSEKIPYKGRKVFGLYKETSPKAVDKYLDLTLCWENDSSLSVDIEEIK